MIIIKFDSHLNANDAEQEESWLAAAQAFHILRVFFADAGSVILVELTICHPNRCCSNVVLIGNSV